jgi:hypothetical protein
MRRLGIVVGVLSLLVGSCSDDAATSTTATVGAATAPTTTTAPETTSTTTTAAATTTTAATTTMATTATTATAAPTTTPAAASVAQTIETAADWIESWAIATDADGLPLFAALRNPGTGISSWGLWRCRDARCADIDGPVELGSPSDVPFLPRLVALEGGLPVLGHLVEAEVVELYACNDPDCASVETGAVPSKGGWGLLRGPAGEGIFWAYQEPHTLHVERWSDLLGEQVVETADFDTNGGPLVWVTPPGEVVFLRTSFVGGVARGSDLDVAVCRDLACDEGPDVFVIEEGIPPGSDHVSVVRAVVRDQGGPLLVLMKGTVDTDEVSFRITGCIEETCFSRHDGPWIPTTDWVEGIFDPMDGSVVLIDGDPVLVGQEYTVVDESEGIVENELLIIACDEQLCRSSTVTHTGEVPTGPSAAVAGPDGPIVVYGSFDELRLLVCDDAACTNAAR